MKQSIKNIFYSALLIVICSTTVGADSNAENRTSHKIKKIMIDPGFGGKEPGPRGSCPDSSDSKDIDLAISLKLAKMIKERLGIDAALTRDVDKTVSLFDRSATANHSNCDLFISIHCNAHKDNQVYGIETYYLNIVPDEKSVTKARHENAGSDQNASDLQPILNDLMQSTKTKESKTLAFDVQNSICKYLGSRYDMVKDRGIKSAPFYVLVGNEAPSIVIETSYISNQRECKRLNSVKYQEDICEGIVQGLEKYIGNLNH